MAADRTEAFPPPGPPVAPHAAAAPAPGSLADIDGGLTLPAPDSGPPAPGPWPSVDGYEILGEMGRGGMGVVYKARQVGLNRLVALKMILSGGHASATDLARFKSEAEAIARLQHPNIVHINEVGDSEGRPFFCLEFVDGGSLAQKLDGTPWPPAAAAQLVETLAIAMQTAHRAGVIHRDLKPANILMRIENAEWRMENERQGGSPFSILHSPFCIPKITDFGLAKQMDSGAGKTQTGAILGTPSYMAPEQAGGRSREIGPATDVYSLGAILYELLTGRPPFKAETPLDTVLQVIGEEPVPPRRLQPKLPRDLDTICLKCLEKNPAKRYPAAADLADDLARWRQLRPIRARRISQVGRAVRWCRRNPVLAVESALAIAIIVILSVVFYVSLLRENGRTRAALQQAQIEEDQGKDILVRSLFEQARAVRLSNEPGRRWKALELLAQAEKLRNRQRLVELPPDELEQPLLSEAELRREAAAVLLIEDARVFREVSLAAMPGISARVSTDGRHVMAWWARLQKTPPELGIRLFDLSDGRILREEELPIALRTMLALSPDEKTLAFFNGDGTLQLRDFAKGGHTRSINRPNEPAVSKANPLIPEGILFSPNGRYVAGIFTEAGILTNEPPTHLYLWDLQDNAASRHLARLESGFPDVGFRDDSKILAYRMGGNKVALRDLVGSGTTSEIELPLNAAGASPIRVAWQATTLAWSPTEPLLAVTATSPSGKGTVLLWDTDAGKEQSRWEGDFNPSQVVLAFSPDGKRLACGSDDGTIRCYHLPDRREILRLDGAHHFGVECLRWESPDRLLSAGSSNNFRAWEFSSGSLRSSVPVGLEATGPMVYSPNGAWLAYRTDDARPRMIVVECASGNVRHSWELPHTIHYQYISFRRDSGQVAWATDVGDAVAWDLADGREIVRCKSDDDVKSTDKSFAAAYLPDGRLVTPIVHKDRVVLRDLISRVESDVLLKLSAKDLIEPGTKLRVSGDGRLLMRLPNQFVQADHGIPIWDLTSGERAELGPLEDEVSGFTDATPSPDGRRLLKICFPASYEASVGSSEPILSMWDLDTRQRLWRMQRNVRPTSWAFSADGRLLAIGYQNGFVELWDAEHGEELFRWQPRGSREVRHIAFTPDNANLATSDAAAPVQILHLAELRRQLAAMGLDW